MNISDKIEEIRKKPEHIRMRYVWAGVLIAMFLIIIIWFFSLQETFKNSAPKPDTESFQNQWEKTKENMPSIGEFIQNTDQSPSANEISPQENKSAPENNTEN